MSCRHVRDWLHRDAASLDEAQRLQLDDHLAVCEACRGDRARMQTLHRAGASLDAPPADARMYDRAIARALLEGPRAVEAPRTRWMWPVAIGAAAAVAMVIALALRGGDEPVKDIASTGRDVEPNPTASKGHDVEPNPTASTRHDVEPGPAIDPHSAPRPGLDPHIEMSPDRATPDVAGANELRVQIAASAMAGTTAIDREDIAVPNESTAPHVSPRDSTASKSVPAVESVADVLARARLELAAKHYADAEHTASSVISRASTADEAEARTIVADVAQASGQLELASTRYRDVAARFASLPAGESALYAAARVEARRGRDARALLEQYLARYPRGRFVDDARRLLSQKENR